MLLLSWLLVHGPIIWGAALVAAAIAGPCALLLRRATAARSEARAARRRLGEPLPDKRALVDGEIVTLRGKLSAHGARTVRLDDGAPAAVTSAERGPPWKHAERGPVWKSARAARLALVDAASGKEIAPLEGPIRIVVGSRDERLPRVTLALRGRAIEAGVEKALAGEGEIRTRSLDDGDLVRVRGRLRRVSAVDPTGGYREEASVWALVGEGEGALEAACERAPRVAVGSKARLVAAAAIAAAAFAGGWTALAEIGIRMVGAEVDEISAEWTPGRIRRGALHPDRVLVAVAVAAASPIHRKRALERAPYVLSLRCYAAHDEKHAELTAWVYLVQHSCYWGTRQHLRHHLDDRGELLARRCGTSRGLAHVAYQRGRFEEAARLLERAKLQAHAPTVRVDIEACLLAGQGAAWAAQSAADLSYERRELPVDHVVLSCLSDALHGLPLHGPPIEAERARTPAEERAFALCRLLSADRLRGRERLAALDALAPIEPGSTLPGQVREHASQREVASLLRLETELGVDDGAPAATPASPCPPRAPHDPELLDHPAALFERASALAPPALARRVLSALEAGSAPCARRMQVAVPVAAFEALAGDAAEARRVAKLAVADAPSGASFARAMAFAAAIELRVGDAERARWTIIDLPSNAPDREELQWLADFATDRVGHPIRAKGSSPLQTLGWRFDQDLRDGEQIVATVLEEPGHIDLLALAAPKLDRGREALREWLRWGDKPSLWGPISDATTAASLRDIAEALGEPAIARRHADVASAFHQAILRREIAVPLWVLHAP